MGLNEPLICNACGKVYLDGDADGICDDPRCYGAKLDNLLGFVSYRRYCQTHRGPEANDLALRIKDRVEKVLHARRISGGFFIDKTGIEREDFESKIARTLRCCAGRIFLLILTPGAFDKAEGEEDWLLKEVRLAIENKMEIIPVIATKYRSDSDFEWPRKMTTEIAAIQRENVNLTFIGDLDERSLTDTTQSIASEVVSSIRFKLPVTFGLDQNDQTIRKNSQTSAHKEVANELQNAIGVDVGGTKIRGCHIAFADGDTFAINSREYSVDIEKPASARSIIEQVKNMINLIYVEENLDRGSAIGIGIAAAGQVDLKAGVLKFAPSLSLRNLSLKTHLATEYRAAQIRIDNDVRCATRCEMHLGIGKDFDNLVCIYIGTGVGSGISINRQILFGSNYCAGEIGHIKIASEGPMCKCGQSGCLETFVNSTALSNRAQARAIDWKNRGLTTLLSENAEFNTPKEIARIIEMGDAAAQEIVDEIGVKLGIGIANYLNLVNPDAVVLGGGVMSGFFSYMSDGIYRGIRENALSNVVNTPIVHSQFSDTGPALGAALLFHPKCYWPF